MAGEFVASGYIHNTKTQKTTTLSTRLTGDKVVKEVEKFLKKFDPKECDKVSVKITLS